MVAAGRIVCVALPFLLTVVSIIALLVTCLAGITNKSLYMFEVNTTDLSISTSDLESLLDSRSLVEIRSILARHAPKVSTRDTTTTTTNITASDLGIGKLYDIDLWNYCLTPQSGSRNCSKAAYNWAAKAANETEESFEDLLETYGLSSSELPSGITKALSIFPTLSRWTQIFFAISFAFLAAEILVGLFSGCSRIISCLTFLVAMGTAISVTAAAGLATGTMVAVVSVVDSTAKQYGVSAKMNTHYLAAVWIAAAAALCAAFFWMFTVCCCSPDSRMSSRRRGAPMGAGAMPLSDKPMASGAYQPINDPHMSPSYYNNGYAPQTQYGAPRQANGRADLAYEPYSHSRV